MGAARRELGRFRKPDLEVEDHGFLTISGHFEYAASGCVVQGLGYAVDAEFIKRFLGVFGVGKLSQVEGKVCWVTYRGWNEPIVLLEPVFEKDGKAFDIEKWADERRKEAQSRDSGGY